MKFLLITFFKKKINVRYQIKEKTRVNKMVGCIGQLQAEIGQLLGKVSILKIKRENVKFSPNMLNNSTTTKKELINFER